MTTETPQTENELRVIVAGGGVAALETVLALADLAPDRTDVTVIAPNREFVYRPMTVREPFAYGAAQRYPLASIVNDAGATLLSDELAWVDPGTQTIHTKGGQELPYDALMLALGASAHPRYEHALTIDDSHMDETLHGLIQDIEGGYVRSLAFVAPGRMPWPLPLYELALMTAGRAFDMNVELAVTIVSPEDTPLAVFGANASLAVSKLLQKAHIVSVNSAYAEVPSSKEVVINPGDRHLHVDRVIALPELYGPAVRGIPLATHGFIRVDRHGRLLDAGPIYAAGDAVDFPVKHGGISAQQADAAAQAIAAAAGAHVTPEPFTPVIRGMLLTDGDPVYLTAKITGGHGFSSEITDTPTWSPAAKIAARYLAPCLEEYDSAHAAP
ncbi:MAG TPA: FAD-dependent oxidoreductase [Solirubrobacteraceae bacterium]|jgi:sulfide:quinone oxidoreductase|nr:FAD-dependent oxidoreductase [Solirubrobacteraceae bacterium]